MSNVIKLKRGLNANLPAGANDGEPLVTTDNHELWIGTGSSKFKVTDTSKMDKTPNGQPNKLMISDGSGGVQQSAYTTDSFTFKQACSEQVSATGWRRIAYNGTLTQGGGGGSVCNGVFLVAASAGNSAGKECAITFTAHVGEDGHDPIIHILGMSMKSGQDGVISDIRIVCRPGYNDGAAIEIYLNDATAKYWVELIAQRSPYTDLGWTLTTTAGSVPTGFTGYAVGYPYHPMHFMVGTLHWWFDDEGGMAINNNTVWHAGNDGAASQLDADFLDGQEGTYYRNADNLNAGTLPAARFNDTSHGSRSGGTLHSAATTGTAGFMSAADKTKLDNYQPSQLLIGTDASKPASGWVANRLYYASDTKKIYRDTGSAWEVWQSLALSDATGTINDTQHGSRGGGTLHSAATTGTAGFMSASDKTKLNGIATGAEVNQNAFSNVLANGVTCAADSKTDTLEIAAGTGISVTGDAANDRVTIAVSSAVVLTSGDQTIAGTKTFSNNVVVNGDLTINGTTTTLDTTNLVIEDNDITLNKNESGAGVTAGTAGITIERGTLTNAQLYFDESDDTWKRHNGTNAAALLDVNSTVDGGTF